MLKTTIATTFLEVGCSCPYCDAFEDIIDNNQVKEEIKEAINSELSSSTCNIEIECSECKQTFVVTDIKY